MEITEDVKKREQEQAYIIPSEVMEEFATDLLERKHLGEYKLSKLVSHQIQDSYYDTPDNDLRMSTVSFRTRLLDDKLLVSFKGKEKNGDFTQDHDEWEFVWPYEGVTPDAFIDAAGLQLVQRRDTTRMTRKLFDEDHNTIAEVNLDASVYTVSTGTAKIYELEVERQGDVKLKKILKAIEEELPMLASARWPHGKFVTGKAIEFAFGVQKDADNTLDSNSFGYIDAMFKQLKVFK